MLASTIVSRSARRTCSPKVGSGSNIVTIVRVAVAVLGEATEASSSPTDSPATLLSS